MQPKLIGGRALGVSLAVLLVTAPPLMARISEQSKVDSFASVPVERNAFSPLQTPTAPQPEKVRLGKILFFDKRLSGDRSVSCSSCHLFSRGGADGQPLSIGIHGQLGDANAPTVFNSSLNFRQFWDGRVQSLQDQVGGPVTNPKEMGGNWDEITARINDDVGLRTLFISAYGERATPNNIADAIASFEAMLITLDSPFDRYLKGDRSALSAPQIRGMKKFETFGCVSCHQGVNLGGNMYQTLGVTGDYFKDRGGVLRSDAGRFNITKKESDRHVFRVPSLRNVAETAPYFHDGSIRTLREAVKVMAKYQLGRKLSERDTTDLVFFLNSLTGKIPAAVMDEPRL